MTMRLPNLREEARYVGLPAHVRNIAEALAAFDPNVYIEILPSSHPQFNPQKQFSVTHRPPGAESYVVSNHSAAEVDVRILADFIEGLNDVHGQASYDAFESWEKASEILKAKKRQEERAEKAEQMGDLMRLGDKKHYAKHNGRYLNDDQAVAAPTTIYLGK